MKKLLVFMLVCMMITGMTAGCVQVQDDEGGDTGTETEDTVVEELPPVQLTMLIRSHSSWPYNEDWWIWDAIKEKTNVTFDVTAVASNYDEKVNITVASGNIPDIVNVGEPIDANKYGAQGAFLNLKPYIEETPNFDTFLKNHPEVYMAHLSADGKLYAFPYEGIGETNRRGWLYRKDIFDKHNLEIPANCEEMYQTLKKLKKLYPDSYPLSYRKGLRAFEMMTPQWGTGYQYYYDEAKDEWRYGPVEENYKAMVLYFKKLYMEKLIPPDWLTLSTKQWQDLMSTSVGFITNDYLGRIDFFNIPMRKENPDFNLAYMPPPAGGENGQNKHAYSAIQTNTYCVGSTTKKLDRILKLVNYYYSDEGREFLSWGKEGETYKTVNGERKFIGVETMADLRNNYGISTYGTCLWFDYDSHISTFTPELKAAVIESRKYDDLRDPEPALTESEYETVNNVGASIKKHYEEQISKFIMGERDISEWDNYVEEIKNLGVNKILEIYSNAYDRVQSMK